MDEKARVSQMVLSGHKHKLEYSKEENYQEVWVCRGCNFEERHFIECL